MIDPAPELPDWEIDLPVDYYQHEHPTQRRKHRKPSKEPKR